MTGSDPLALVLGDPDGVQDLATTYAARGETYSQAYVTVENLDLSGWTGQAARAAQDKIDAVATDLRKAASAYESAGVALSVYAWTLAWAQNQAQVAIDTWDAGRYCGGGDQSPFDPNTLTVTQRDAPGILADARNATSTRQQVAGYAPINPGFWNGAGYCTTQFLHGATLDPILDLGAAWEGSSTTRPGS